MAESVLQYSVRKTKDLFARRPSAEDWARNLLEGSKRLKSKHDWDKFYTFITNPEAYEEGEIPEDFSPAKISEGIPTDYPTHMKVVKTMNGNETLIHVVNTRRSRDEDDEKVPC
jgi:hypothetical protein